ncbi:MAG TPA: ribonuclease P protein component [Gammaproteobacteria bacterium]|jgi:ribonuclease P protein component|nr:ribonuclease P protein component [Gammaproteobacteria bacterium]
MHTAAKSFPRERRLSCQTDFRAVFGQSQKSTSHYLLALHRPNGRTYARLGIVVPKHHIKQSVDRNMLKRQIRESFRHRQNTLAGKDIVVLIRSKCPFLAQNNRHLLRANVDNLWTLVATS